MDSKLNFTTLKPEDRDFSGGRHYIGASDMGTLAGINKYRTPFKLWQKLTGKDTEERDSDLNEKASWGHALEPAVIHRFFVERYGATLADKWLQSRIKGAAKHKMANGVVVHSFSEARCRQFKHGVAHADAVVVEPDLMPDGETKGETYLIEAKTTSFFNKRGVDPRRGYDFSTDSDKGIPLGVYLQVQWQMTCYDVDRTYTCCLMGGQQWQCFGPSAYVPKIAEKLLAKSQKMWRHVEAKEPVQPGDFDDVCELFPEVEEKTSRVIRAEAEEEALAKLTRYAKLAASVKKAKDEQTDIRNAFAVAIEGNNFLEASDGVKLATQITKTRTGFNMELFIKEHPEIAEAAKDKKYHTKSISREIRVAKPPKSEGN